MVETINFEDFNIVDAPHNDNDLKLTANKQYIIGCDPFDQVDDPDVSVFSVFDKNAGRQNLKMRTKKHFDWFVDFIQRNEILNNFVVSRKFINEDGRAKKPREITA